MELIKVGCIKFGKSWSLVNNDQKVQVNLPIANNPFGKMVQNKSSDHFLAFKHIVLRIK